MSERAAIVTGASRGIGLAVAEFLAEEGFALTITARKADTLARTADGLRARGHDVEHVAANIAQEEAVQQVVGRHTKRYGRLDLLVNNAGIGVGASATEHQTRFVDLQINVNLRAIILFYRECAGLLRAAASETGKALVVNVSSLAGKAGQPWLSVYSATKAGVISYTEAMNKELGHEGVRSVAFCPGFVDTDMSNFVKGSIDPADMLPLTDIVEAVRFTLALSPICTVPEIVFRRTGEVL